MSFIKKIFPFFAVIFIASIFFTDHHFFSISDSEDMLNISVSIYELHDMSLSVKTNLITGEQIKDYSKYGLGLPLFLVPFLYINDLLHSIFGNVNSNIVLAFPNVLILAATALAVHLIIISLGYSYRRGLFLSLLTIFGTFAFPYINFFLSEPLQAFSITLTCLCLFKGRNTTSIKQTYALLTLGGIVYCFGILTKATLLIFIPFFVLYLFLTVQADKDKKLLPIISSFMIPIIVFGFFVAFLNYYRYSSIFDFGYGKEMQMFVNPVSTGIFNFLFNPDKSLFLFAPAMALFPYAFWKFTKQYKEEGILIVLLVITNLLLYSAWWAWEGGDSWGPRFLLPMIPISMIPFATILHQRLLKTAVIILFVAGFLINSLSMLQDPTGYSYIVLNSTDKMALNTDRPKRDYLDRGGYKQVPPFVVSSTLPQFSVIKGHLWLLRSKYEGWLKGYGLSKKNDTFKNPPWIMDFPQHQVPEIQSLPKEIKIRIECPTPLILSYLICPNLKPSMPYYYDALTQQADKIETLGFKDKALNLRRKAVRETKEKRRRIRQMSYH